MRKLAVAVVVYLILIVVPLLPDYSDPGPPPKWRHMNDTPADVVGDQTMCVTGSLAEPGGVFCTQEAIEE